MAEIYQAIIGVMSDIGAIGKGKYNSQQGFKYRGVDDVMNALQPSMVKHELFVAPEIIDQKREERQTKNKGNLIYSVCTVRYTFYANDGSSVQCVVIGEGMDSGDKATNKAMSVAFKYACFQVFCIPTEEMKDPAEERAEREAEGGPEGRGGESKGERREKAAGEDQRRQGDRAAGMERAVQGGRGRHCEDERGAYRAARQTAPHRGNAE